MLKISVLDMSLKITILRLQPNLPGNELINCKNHHEIPVEKTGMLPGDIGLHSQWSPDTSLLK